MHRFENTIMNFSWDISSSVYQFLKLWRMFLIGKCSVMLEEANEIKIVPWINLQRCFQLWVFCKKFQFVNGVFWAAACVKALGLCSLFMYESIRSTKLIKIFCIHGFEDLIFKHCFFNLFHAFLYQLWSNQIDSFQS